MGHWCWRGPLWRGRLPLARQGFRQGVQLSMHMDYQGLVNAAALMGAALPDAHLTTNLGLWLQAEHFYQ